MNKELENKIKSKRKNIKSFIGLVVFLFKMRKLCKTDEAIAVSEATLATTWYFRNKFYITKFYQKSIMWRFIAGWVKTNNKCGMSLVDYDDMLYPQCEGDFDKTIDSETFKRLQEKAKNNLEEFKDIAHSEIINHWKSIVNGDVPFGYHVSDAKR